MWEGAGDKRGGRGSGWEMPGEESRRQCGDRGGGARPPGGLAITHGAPGTVQEPWRTADDRMDAVREMLDRGAGARGDTV